MSEYPSLEVLVDQARDAAALTQAEAQQWFHHMEAALETLEQAPPEQTKAMEEFLSRGGKVQEVEANVVADPPKKPDNKYGSRPI